MLFVFFRELPASWAKQSIHNEPDFPMWMSSMKADCRELDRYEENKWGSVGRSVCRNKMKRKVDTFVEKLDQPSLLLSASTETAKITPIWDRAADT